MSPSQVLSLSKDRFRQSSAGRPSLLFPLGVIPRSPAGDMLWLQCQDEGFTRRARRGEDREEVAPCGEAAFQFIPGVSRLLD
jgi:hypothetical protein